MWKRVLIVHFMVFAFVLSLAIPSIAQQNDKGYGFDEAFPELHVFLTNQFWDYGSQTFGKYANVGDNKEAGHSVFIPMSGYVDISSQINPNLKAEAEFELYKGGDGALKICKMHGLWTPREWFNLAMGRDFVPIGTQDKSYYPTSGYRMFTVAPFLYRTVMRASGWWDTGVFASGRVQLSKQVALLYNLSISNGPGDSHQTSTTHLVDKMSTKAEYMYEAFHSDARQFMDNNNDKPVCLRLAISPVKELEIGGSYFKAKYDATEQHSCEYTFFHLLYETEHLNLAGEYGQIGIDVNPLKNPRGDKKIHQSSAYIAASYKIIEDKYRLHFLAPAIRYETFDPWEEDTTNKGDRKSTSIGIILSPQKHFLIRTAYQHTTEKGPKLENDGLSVETVFEF